MELMQQLRNENFKRRSVILKIISQLGEFKTKTLIFGVILPPPSSPSSKGHPIVLLVWSWAT